jgi:hypothetical protein
MQVGLMCTDLQKALYCHVLLCGNECFGVLVHCTLDVHDVPGGTT